MAAFSSGPSSDGLLEREASELPPSTSAGLRWYVIKHLSQKDNCYLPIAYCGYVSAHGNTCILTLILIFFLRYVLLAGYNEGGYNLSI